MKYKRIIQVTLSIFVLSIIFTVYFIKQDQAFLLRKECKTFYSLEEVADKLETGDIFLAHGDSVISEIIEDLTWTEWSHSGLIIRASDLKIPELKDLGDELLLWESTAATDLKDLLTASDKSIPLDNSPHGGTYLVKLKDRVKIDIEIGEIPIAIRKLKIKRSSKILSALTATVKEHQNSRFPTKLKFVENYFLGRFENKPSQTPGQFFCSELVATTLMNIGVLSKTKYLATHYNPKDFSIDSNINIPMINKAKLGKMICIDRL